MFKARPGHLFSAPKRIAAILTLGGIGALGHASAQGPISVEVDSNHVLWTVPENYHGTNFVALWNDTGASPGTVAAFAQLGARLVRFPGGVPAEWYDCLNPLQSGLSSITPQDAYRLAQAGNAEMIFQTNVFNGKPGKNKKTGEDYQWDNSGKHAADWVVEAKKEGMKVAFWEIGNEPEMDADKEAKRSQDSVYKVYDAKFEEQARAMKAVDPTAWIMGPASTNTYFWWTQKNLDKFLQAEGNREGTGLVDAVSIHWYQGGNDGSWEKNRGKAQEWQGCMNYIESRIKEYDSRPLPVYITEWNWGAGDHSDGAERISNALGCADCVGMFLRTGVSGHTFFCLQHVNHGWGVLTTKGGDYKPQDYASPSFYAMAMASHLGGHVLEVKNSADEKNVLSAYATRDATTNALSVMLINKGSDQQDVQVSFDGAHPSTAKVYTLLPADGGIQDKEVIYNGATSPQPATEKLPDPAQVPVSGPFVQKMAPYSLAVITFS